MSEEIVSQIHALSSIARTNGTCLSLREILALTAAAASETDLEKSWKSTPALVSRYNLEQGLVLDLGYNDGRHVSQIFEERKMRAEQYLRMAVRLLPLLQDKDIRLVSISGSTSYLSTSNNDDLDLFCVTREDSLWLFLTKVLLLTRVFRTLHPSFPRICFSYVMDEKFAEKTFRTPGDALFARDALTTIVLHGKHFYSTLLRRSNWISNHYPKLYTSRIGSPGQINHGMEHRQETSTIRRFTNNLLFLLICSYVRARSYDRNLELQKKGKTAEFFKARTGKDHCIFESTRYRNLRGMYRSFSREVQD